APALRAPAQPAAEWRIHWMRSTSFSQSGPGRARHLRGLCQGFRNPKVFSHFSLAIATRQRNIAPIFRGSSHATRCHSLSPEVCCGVESVFSSRPVRFSVNPGACSLFASSLLSTQGTHDVLELVSNDSYDSPGPPALAPAASGGSGRPYSPHRDPH